MLTILTSEWWHELNSGEKTFWAIAIISTILFVLQTVLAFVGLDGDMDVDGMGEVDLDFDGDSDFSLDSDFRVFSVRSLIAFFTFFSWGGILILNAGMSIYLAVLVGLGFGLSAMFFVAWVLFKVANMTEDGTEDLSLSVGKTGEVYIPIPAGRQGKGKIQIIISQSVKEMEAITDGPKISTGEKVLILDILPDNILIVKKIITM